MNIFFVDNNSFAELNVVEASYAYSMMAFAHGFKMLLETFNDSVTTPSVNSTSITCFYFIYNVKIIPATSIRVLRHSATNKIFVFFVFF